MRLHSISMKKWTLWGAVPLAVVNPFHTIWTVHGMILWMLLGLIMPERHPSPYQRKIGPLRESARAFLALSSGVFVLSIMEFFAYITGIYGSTLGNIYALSIPFIAQIGSATLLLNHVPPRQAVLYGCLLLCPIFLLW